MIVVLGLGNIGKQYANTRHNIGFMLLDNLAKTLNKDFSEDKRLMCCKLEISLKDFIESSNMPQKDCIESKILLIKPTTFMNNSGECVAKVAKMYDITKMIVIYDDLDTPFGSFNVKESGGSGGHNGLKSINAHFTKQYMRAKLGIRANRFCSKKAKSLLSLSGENEVMFDIICESFTATLLRRYNFDSEFKKKSFDKVFRECVLSKSQKYPRIESFLNEIISTPLHKVLGENIANYVLSDFTHIESNLLDSILTYSIFCVRSIIADYCYQTNGKFDIFNVRFNV